MALLVPRGVLVRSTVEPLVYLGELPVLLSVGASVALARGLPGRDKELAQPDPLPVPQSQVHPWLGHPFDDESGEEDRHQDQEVARLGHQVIANGCQMRAAACSWVRV
jgi:hypothetical protein